MADFSATTCQFGTGFLFLLSKIQPFMPFSRYFRLCVLFFLSTVRLGAQDFPAEQLTLEWENLENDYQGSGKFLSVFRFKNTTKKVFPAQGWTLYFNMARGVQKDALSGNAAIEHRNGDLYALRPGVAFKALKPGEVAEIRFWADDYALNVSDAPSGPFLVWDPQPERGISLPLYTIAPFTRPEQYRRRQNDGSTLPSPEGLFEQYAGLSLLPATDLPLILPTPVRQERRSGLPFRLSSAMPVFSAPALSTEAQYLCDELARVLGKAPQRIPSMPGNDRMGIYLQVNKNLAPEAYTLRISQQMVVLEAADGAGIFYAIQSLKMLLPADAWRQPLEAVELSPLYVEDQPRFGHRGMMLDVGRHFHQKKEVLKMLDLMALYKLNVLHFHLTEDEGWRLEIPGLPELTEVGARRGHTINGQVCLPPSFGSGPMVGVGPGSGYYSRADFVDILRYATRLHIRVLPEIESPGHARAAVQAMRVRGERLRAVGRIEEADTYLLHDPADASVYQSVQGWTDNVINVAQPSVYRFMDKIMAELQGMYREAGAPLECIHFGGDEVPAGVWKKSPLCKALLAKHPKYRQTEDLWYYFYERLDSLARARGLAIAGWEEMALRKTQLNGAPYYIPNPDFVHRNWTVNVWNNVPGWGNEDLAYRLANSGYGVVLSCVSNLYFDLAYSQDPNEIGYYWGGYVDVDKPFYFIPFEYFKNVKYDRAGQPLDPAVFVGKDGLTEYGRAQIRGIQGHLWSENLFTPERLEYMLLPKLLGLAERAWAPDPAWATEPDPKRAETLYQQAWNVFANSLGQKELPRLQFYAGGFKYRIPPVGMRTRDGRTELRAAFPGMSIRYSTDGSEPTPNSPLYQEPFEAAGKLVKAKGFPVTLDKP
jgi:hexosaminidase